MDKERMQTIEVHGVLLHYAVYGSGKPIVLVHGNGEDHTLFEVEIGQLVDAGYQVFAPDSRGHGANEPVTECHYADMTEDTWQFIQKMGLEKPAYYGHSDGGIIGLMLEIEHPGTLGRLAISGTNLRPEGMKASFLKRCAEENEKDPDPFLTMMLEEPDIDPRSLEKIDIPVLVTVGEKDLIIPEETERIVSHLPDARLVVVEGARHGDYIEGSKIMGELLLEFL